MADTVLAQLASLRSAPVSDLKQKWRDLFEREPPPYNRRFLENRLAYRIQELAYGGLSQETLERLDTLADELDGKKPKRHSRIENRPIAGTRLIREWRGVEHCVTVRQEDFEYQGRPYKSLSAIARHITGTQLEWPRLLRHEKYTGPIVKEPLAIKRKLRCAVYTRKSSEEGLEQEFNSLDAQREALRSLCGQPKG